MAMEDGHRVEGITGEVSCEVREEDAMLVREKQPLGHW